MAIWNEFHLTTSKWEHNLEMSVRQRQTQFQSFDVQFSNKDVFLKVFQCFEMIACISCYKFNAKMHSNSKKTCGSSVPKEQKFTKCPTCFEAVKSAKTHFNSQVNRWVVRLMLLKMLFINLTPNVWLFCSSAPLWAVHNWKCVGFIVCGNVKVLSFGTAGKRCF